MAEPKELIMLWTKLLSKISLIGIRMDGLLGIILFLFFILWLSIPFLVSSMLTILVGQFFEERRKRFKARMITWSVLLPVIVPCYLALFSQVYSFWNYLVFFYTDPSLVGFLAVVWVMGSLSMLVLDHFKKQSRDIS